MQVPNTNNPNDWLVWSKRVLGDIERVEQLIKDHDERLRRMEQDIAVVKSDLAKLCDVRVDTEVLKSEMKTKAGIWGMMAGAIPVAIMIAVGMLKG